MSRYGFKIALLHVFIAANIPYSLQSNNVTTSPKAVEDSTEPINSNEIKNGDTPITLDMIKKKLKESGVFDSNDPTLTAVEKKQLGKLFEAVKIMTSSRSRQPSNVQTMFSSIRAVERAVKKHFKEGQISESLAAKFKWEKISPRHKRSHPAYVLDKKTNMRVFDI